MLASARSHDVLACNLCSKKTGRIIETAVINSDIRKFKKERFGVWRCPSCRAFNSRDEVDLNQYYAGYPSSFDLDGGFGGIATCSDACAGWVQREHFCSIICGGAPDRVFEESAKPMPSATTSFRRGQGQERARPPIRFHTSQDVIEHVLERGSCCILRSLGEGGSIIAIGTPNAETIDSNVQILRARVHQPSHSHLSRRADRSGEKLGWNSSTTRQGIHQHADSLSTCLCSALRRVLRQHDGRRVRNANRQLKFQPNDLSMGFSATSCRKHGEWRCSASLLRRSSSPEPELNAASSKALRVASGRSRKSGWFDSHILRRQSILRQEARAEDHVQRSMAAVVGVRLLGFASGAAMHLGHAET